MVELSSLTLQEVGPGSEFRLLLGGLGICICKENYILRLGILPKVAFPWIFQSVWMPPSREDEYYVRIVFGGHQQSTRLEPNRLLEPSLGTVLLIPPLNELYDSRPQRLQLQ